MRLKGKVAIVTGSSKGIGRAIALLCAQEGACVVVNYNKDVAAAKEVVATITKAKGNAICVKADVSKQADVKKLFKETLNAFGTVDILVNNAGIVRPKEFVNLTLADWEETMRTNVTSMFLCSQEAAKIMLAQKSGKIVNISSIRGLPHCGRAGIVDYSTSKGAVISFTTTLAKALAPYITVNSVAPGYTETDMAKTWSDVASKIADTPLKRLMQPEDIAQAVLYFAADSGNAVTGEVLVVDGGNNMK
ncbi:3-oxoacyl-ACP reductase FabG [Candidatus Woesearchaeota archaeon]|nr:3-oxoacyl-ACP reductase FabG [Candidatus Woesearchaeota archaeon]